MALATLCLLCPPFHKLLIGGISEVVVVAHTCLPAILLPHHQVHGCQQMRQILPGHTLNPSNVYTSGRLQKEEKCLRQLLLVGIW